MDKRIVIASAARTPVGSFGGALKDVSAIELGRIAAVAAMARANVTPEMVDELIMGNVLQAGLGQGPARQVAVKAGIPADAPSFAVNKLCGSGLKAVALAVQAVLLGDADVVAAGGAESMSGAPYLLPAARFGYKMGDGAILDSMIKDGLTDAFFDYHMGITAENIAEEQGITRAEQDAFAAESQNRAERAIAEGKFKDEITPVVMPGRKGDITVDTDEYPRAGTTAESLGKLKPAFKKDGTVTAGNASGINDGAAFVVVTTAEKAAELGVEPLAEIVAYASAGVKPETMGYGPIASTKKALAKAGMTVADLDLIEANEAFAVQALAVMRGLGLDPAKVNVNGGAIALGHPIGASGARVLTTLLFEMKRQNAKTGLATLCIGGGQGISLIVKR